VLSFTYTPTARTLALLAHVHEQLGQVRARHMLGPQALLQKAYTVSAIHATLAIEGSALDQLPVAQVLNARPHETRPEAMEVLNTQRAYELLPTLDPFSAQDIRQAHGVLMNGLALDAGSYRTGNMEVLYGEQVAHRMAPAANMPSRMEELLYALEVDDAPATLTACVAHFGIAHLRPFGSGNGRMARLWQRALLMRHWPVFSFLPVEAFILHREPAYHASMAAADRSGDAGAFIIYLLERIREALTELLSGRDPVLATTDRLTYFLQQHGQDPFGRRDYMSAFPRLSAATASRDLAWAVGQNRITRTGTKRSARYQMRSALLRPSDT
jgi:Fic family protein